MKMSPATKMMVMSDRYKKAGQNSGEQRNGSHQGQSYHSGGYQDTSVRGRQEDGMERRYSDDPRMRGEQDPYATRGMGGVWSGQRDSGMGDRRGRREEPRDDQRRRSMNRREQYDDDDDDDDDYGGRGKPQRMYAAGMAWIDSEEDAHEKKRHKEHKEVDEECAMEWVRGMKAVDGTPMPKYKPEQAEQLRKAHCPECKEWEFFAAMNMMYADYSEVAKKLGINRDDYYALMAKAFLTDEDAAPHKLATYMEEIPKK